MDRVITHGGYDLGWVWDLTPDGSGSGPLWIWSILSGPRLDPLGSDPLGMIRIWSGSDPRSDPDLDPIWPRSGLDLANITWN